MNQEKKETKIHTYNIPVLHLMKMKTTEKWREKQFFFSVVYYKYKAQCLMISDISVHIDVLLWCDEYEVSVCVCSMSVIH